MLLELEVLIHDLCVFIHVSIWQNSVFPALALLCEPWRRARLYGNRSSSSGGDKIKTYSIPSPLKATMQRCQQAPANKLTQPTVAHEMHQ